MFTADFFTANRKRLYAQLQPHSVLVLTANGAMQAMPDGPYRFKQESNFWYLSGICYADWRLIVDIDEAREWLVSPQLSYATEIFEGSLSATEATKQSGIATVISKREGNRLLQKLLTTKQHIYTLPAQPKRVHDFYTNPARRDLLRQLDRTKIQDVTLPLAKLRASKQPLELKAMQQALDITVDGLRAVIQALPSLQYEYEAEAILQYEFRRRGAMQGFDPIIASGDNTCIIHYLANNSRLPQDGWLLTDVGAEVYNYPADMGRTIPIGQPTKKSVTMYEAVLRIRNSLLPLYRPGQNVAEFLKTVDQVVMDEMAAIGIIKAGDFKAMRRHMPHAIGHGLGLDCHDPLGQPEVFAENMVVTLEPGIYLPDEGIGIRNEDAILITKDGPHNMSGNLPTELAELRGILKRKGTK